MATIAYVAVLEKNRSGSWSGYIPDLPGCSFSGSYDDTVYGLREKAAQHLADLVAQHEAVPVPAVEIERILVPLPAHRPDQPAGAIRPPPRQGRQGG